MGILFKYPVPVLGAQCCMGSRAHRLAGSNVNSEALLCINTVQILTLPEGCRGVTLAHLHWEFPPLLSALMTLKHLCKCGMGCELNSRTGSAAGSPCADGCHKPTNPDAEVSLVNSSKSTANFSSGLWEQLYMEVKLRHV